MLVVSGLELRPQMGGWWVEGKAADLPGLGGQLMPSDPSLLTHHLFIFPVSCAHMDLIMDLKV